MRFTDFLKATVLLSAGAATLLATLTILRITADYDKVLAAVALGWWLVAIIFGLVSGRRAETSPPITRLLLTARSINLLPEVRPGMTLLNRLWPLLVFTLMVGVIGYILPQIAAVAAGFPIIWALAWRRQGRAVAAIEERDGVRFYVEQTSPVKPMSLVRTPGFGGSFLNYQGET